MTESSGDRIQGIEFGELGGLLDSHEYPATTRELIDAYGEYTLGLEGGSQSLTSVLSSRNAETFESAAEVREAVVGTVGMDAVGRKRYTDRDPPHPSEDASPRPESF